MKHQKQYNKLALVTGATRGIGKAIAIALHKKGYKVIANFNANQKAAEQMKSEYDIEIQKWNIASFQECADNISKIKQKYGVISVLVNNAGITKDATLHKMKLQNWSEVINVNLNSLFNTTRNVIEDMREQQYGRIVNISSINAQKGQFGQTNYCAAKAGIIGFTKALALETAKKGITVNAIAPGYIKTDMTKLMNEKTLQTVIDSIPLGRLGMPEEIAACVEYLVGEKADFITGQTIAINGAQYIS